MELSAPVIRLPRLAQLGRVVQIAFVPDDFEKELSFWTETMGVGPFYLLDHIPLQNTRYKGARTEVDLSAALGYWGDIQIELVRQHDASPSMYSDWLSSGRGRAVQHLGIVVDDFDHCYAQLAEAGGVPVMETEIVGATRAAYFELPDEEVAVELLWLKPHFTELWDYMRAQAQTWNGSEPVRQVPPEEVWRKTW